MFENEKPNKNIKTDNEANGVSGNNYVPGLYKNAVLEFMKQCIGEDKYEEVLTHPRARSHPYVVARLILGAADWERYVYIEQNGSLDGFGP